LSLFAINDFLLARLNKQGLGIRALDSVFNAIMRNKILYALLLYFGYLTEGHVKATTQKITVSYN